VKTTDLIDHVASETGMEKSAAKKAVEAVLPGIVDAARKGDEINLLGFGKFKVKDQKGGRGCAAAVGSTAASMVLAVACHR
jgi:DNA-binding protein HU-beta